MATITLIDVPEQIVQKFWSTISYPALQRDGLDWIYNNEVMTTKQDKISRLQGQIDFLRGEFVDADDYFTTA